MAVTVEFFGIPRERAGVAMCVVEATTLAEALHAAGNQYPNFAESCLDDATPRAGYLVNINGLSFTTNPQTTLNPNDAVLFLSADVGG